jgi:hypothetical protein
MARVHDPSLARIFGLIAGFFILGMPMVAYLWETINQLLELRASGIQLLVAVPVLIVFLILLRFLARAVTRLEASRAE